MYALVSALGLGCCTAFSPVAGSRGFSSLGFSLQQLLLLQSTGSRHSGFSSCCVWAQWLRLPGSRAQARCSCRAGLVSPQRVGSSRAKVSCIDRQILYHWAIREAQWHFSCTLAVFLFIVFILFIVVGTFNLRSTLSTRFCVQCAVVNCRHND